MSRSAALIALGFVVLVAPFLGLYGSLVALIEALCGLAAIGIGVAMRAENARRTQSSTPTPVEPALPEDSHPSAIA
ncbi:MAG: hypothetical protein ACREGR_01785 [Minisyncoccia bacterium]